MRSLHPGDPWAYVHGAVALRENGDQPAADALIGEALTRFPDFVTGFAVWADMAVRQRDWEEAAHRWAVVRARFPLDGSGYVLGAQALEQLGRFDDADQVLTEGHTRKPDDPWIAANWGYFAQHRLDAEEALRRFAAMREHVPNHPAGYVSAALVLRDTKRFTEADAMLAGALARFPDDAGPLMDYASIAHANGDHDEEIRRWAILRARFPNQLAGYVNCVTAMRAAGRLDEAEALTAQTLEQFPDRSDVCVEFAWVARNRQDWPEAERRWAVVRERVSGHPVGYIEGTQTLLFLGRIDEAEALISDARVRFPDNQDVAIAWARMAVRRRDFAVAVERWEHVRAEYPSDRTGFAEGSRMLLDAARVDEAEALLTEARERFPESFDLAVAWASSAMRRELWIEAIQRWAAVRQSFPREPAGYVGAARALQHAAHLAEAEALLTDAIDLFPNDPAVRFAWSELATQREGWPEAHRRWQETRSRFPGEVRAWTESANALRHMARAAEADALLEEGLTRFPDNLDVTFAWAFHSVGTQSTEVTLRRWATVRERFPVSTHGYVFGAYALQDNGLSKEAEDLIAEALLRFPSEMEVARAAGEMASRRGDLLLAAERFAIAAKRSPGDLSLARRWSETLISLQRLDDARAVLDDALRVWPNDGGFLRSRVMMDVQTGQVENAFAIWRTAMDNPEIADEVGYELAWTMFGEGLPDDMARVVLMFLLRERDTGDRHWQPQLAHFQHLRGVKPDLAHFARRVVETTPDIVGEPATIDVLKSVLLYDYTDADMKRFIEQYVAKGRVALTAFMFCQNYWKTKKGMFERFTRAFEVFMTDKQRNPAWIIRENAVELLGYLNFAAVHSSEIYAWLIAAMRERLDLGAMQATGLDTIEGVVGNIGLLARIDPLPAPSVLAQPRRLRIALCISGQLRGYKQAFPTWRHLGLDRHDISTFVHVWKNVGRNWQRIWFFSRPNPFLWGMLMAPNALSFLRERYPRLAAAAEAAAPEGNETTVEEIQAYYGTPHVRVEDDRRDRFNNKTNLWKMHYKIEQAHRLALEDGRDFDLMLRVRPDREMLPASTPDWEAIYGESRARRVVFSDAPFLYTERQTWIGDQFAVGTQEVMDVYSTAFSDMETFAQTGRRPPDVPDHLRPHTNMFYLCFYRGLLCKTLPGAGFGGLLDPAIVSLPDILRLTLADVVGRPLDDFDREFINACEAAQPKPHV